MDGDCRLKTNGASWREDHGFYWSATESSPRNAWFYNFGKSGRSFNRQREGKKQMAISVRCVND